VHASVCQCRNERPAGFPDAPEKTLANRSGSGSSQTGTARAPGKAMFIRLTEAGVDGSYASHESQCIPSSGCRFIHSVGEHSF